MPEDVTEVVTEDTTWRFDNEFLRSNWTCIWGRGCVGILPQPAAELGQGCCSLGAEVDEDEAGPIAAFAATIDPERFQFHAEAERDTIFSDESRNATRVVDGACIFLNRPGFEGGAGCALHLEALHCDESPLDWKPSVCWQLPIKVDWQPLDGDREQATVRGWTRDDWGAEGETMAWCCTDGDRAYVGDEPVVDSMAEQLKAIAGSKVYVELRRKLDADTRTSAKNGGR